MGDPKKIHPLTGARIVPLGYRKDGRAIWPIMGASEDQPPADPPAVDPPPSDPPANPPADPGKQPPWGKPENFDADKAWELIQNLRNEKGDPAKVAELETKLAEAQTAQQAQMDALAKALGLKSDDAPPDPSKLAEQITAEQGKTEAESARADAAERQVAIYRLAANGKHEGNPVALLDSATFLKAMAEVDPTDEAAVVAAVKTAIDANPSLKATATPQFPGGPRFSATRPEVGPGLPRLRDAYAQNS